MTYRSVFVNADFVRGGDGALILRLCAEADLIRICEAKDLFLKTLVPPGWVEIQDRSSEARAGSAILYRADVFQLVAARLVSGARPFLGGTRVGMLERFVLAADLIEKSTGEAVTEVAAHAPPRRFLPLQPGYFRVLRGVAAAAAGAVAVGIDANRRHTRAARALGLRSHGVGIMGIFTNPRATVTDFRHRRMAGSDHPVLFATITLTPTTQPPTSGAPTMPETITRAEWGAAPSNGGPGKLNPADVEGLVFHWPGLTKPLRGVGAVSSALRGWQRYHQGTKGWSDIAYQGAVDQDGNIYELRGLLIQSGANGDEDVNRRFGALLLVLAPGEEPSDAMVEAIRSRVSDFRRYFPGARQLRGHTQVREDPTQCPGPIVLKHIARGTFEPQADAPKPKPRTRGPRVDQMIDLAVEALADARKMGWGRRVVILETVLAALRKIEES